MIRNASATPIQNGTITISSDHSVEPLTGGARYGKANDLIYDFTELRPYSDAAQEITVVVKISTKSSALDPTPLLVTVSGKGLQRRYSEVIEYSFVFGPS